MAAVCSENQLVVLRTYITAFDIIVRHGKRKILSVTWGHLTEKLLHGESNRTHEVLSLTI